MKKILMIIPYMSFPGEPGYNRFRYIAEKLAARGHEVHVLTSNFNHFLKEYRDIRTINKLPYNVNLISETGYKKNVSVRRIKSLFILSRNIKYFLKSTELKYDLLYCAYPTLAICNTSGKWAKKRNIPFFIDVQDVWPESIKTVFSLPDFLWNTILFPHTIWANKIYSRADYIIAVSKTYLERALKANKHCKKSLSVYLGSDLSLFRSNGSINKPESEFWACYIGTLSHSYDIKTLILASKNIQEKGYHNIKIFIIGNGPHANDLILLSKKLKCNNIKFVGHLSYDHMIQYLINSDVGLNAMKRNAQQSITNKLCDYISSGLFIINSSQNKEVNYILDHHNLGTNYNPGDYLTLSNLLIEASQNKLLLNDIKQNALDFSRRYMDREIIYQNIFDTIESC